MSSTDGVVGNGKIGVCDIGKRRVGADDAGVWEFPKKLCTCLGVPMIRTLVFWGLYWGPLILGNYHIANGTKP